MSNWKDIDTAPKDGSVVRLWWNGLSHNGIRGKWEIFPHPDPPYTPGDGGRAAMEQVIAGAGHWVTTPWTADPKPTHWMEDMGIR